jgi:small subunit ribosomal protein S7
MPRKGFVSRRTVRPDAVYDSDLVQKFINSMMWDGKRSTAQRIFYTAMEMVGQKGNDEPLKLFKKAVENVKPVLEVKSRRVGGAMKRKEDVHRMAEANKAFAHYRW